MPLSRLHQHISNAERLQIIAEYPLSQVLSAPGHSELRNSAAVTALAQRISAGSTQGLFEQPLLLGLFTDAADTGVQLRSIECIDGHHRLLAGLVSGLWDRIGDLPPGVIDTRVNGCRFDAIEPEDRWVPLPVVRRSTLAAHEYRLVSTAQGAKGETASISGTISGQDPVFAAQDRGITFRRLAMRWQYLAFATP